MIEIGFHVVIFAIVMIAAALLLCAALTVLVAVSMLRPARMSGGRALAILGRLYPTDIGLSFTPHSFAVRDHRSGKSMTIASWWILANDPASSRTAILIHGYGDAKVGALAWAPMWNRLGYHALLIDLRAHGESGGPFCTGGYAERDDLDQVINELRQAHPKETQRLVLFGVSLGATVSIATAARRDDIDALVLDSPFAKARHALAALAVMGGVPRFLTTPARRVAELISGTSFDQVSPSRIFAATAAPALLVEGSHDDFVRGNGARELAQYRPATALTEVWQAPESDHIQIIRDLPGEYERRVGEFLSRVFADSQSLSANPPATPSKNAPDRV